MISVLVPVLLLYVCNANSCTFTASNASYDLTPLSISSQSDRQYHAVHDADLTRNFSYYFNLCEPVHSMPFQVCSNSSKRPAFAHGYCKSAITLDSSQKCPAKDIVPITGHGLHDSLFA